MTKQSKKAPATPRSPALALSRGLFGAPAPRAATRREKAPPPEGDGALCR